MTNHSLLRHLPAAVILAAASGMPGLLLADQADLPDCTVAPLDANAAFADRPDCTISWVENNSLNTLIWTSVKDDFETPTLTQTKDGTAVLRSTLRPELVDVDQNGWLDLMTFTPVGMVNGTFDIFFRDPLDGRFIPAEQLYGHTLRRDDAGYIVVAGRSGAGTILRFFTAARTVLTYRFELDPFVLDPSSGGAAFRCDISIMRSDAVPSDDTTGGGPLPDDPDLTDHYCDTEGAAEREARSVVLGENPDTLDRVPAQTIFYCVLEGGTHAVTIARISQGLRYTYGPLGAVPELAMDRSLDEVTVLPDNGAGPSRFGEIVFTNGAYEYAAYYSYEIFDSDDELHNGSQDGAFPNDTFARGLVAYKDGDTANPVFHKSCLLQRSYDEIFWFNAGRP